MTEGSVQRLYPLPAGTLPLEGLYLSHELRRRGQEAKTAFVYANFITSLDGRIAVSHPAREGLAVPEGTANPRDWRLFQELAAQADVLLSSGRYVRDYEKGEGQELITVYENPAFADLREWRTARGLPLPAFAIVSGSLDFRLPAALMGSGRTVLVVTASGADAARVRALEDQNVRVIMAGENRRVDGRRLVQSLSEAGYRNVYSAAGPRILHLLLAADVLDRLYLTYANRLLGGREFATFVEGAGFAPPIDLRLSALYYDTHALGGAGQTFAVYDRLREA